MKVGIVGAGVSGLSMIRSLKNKGISCVAFEKAKDIGGLWRDNYIGAGIQVPKELYEFPDFRFTEGPAGVHSSSDAVQRYVGSFADKFALRENIRLESEVTKIERDDKGKWVVTVKAGNNTSKDVFDAIVMCTGMYSENPIMPNLKGKEQFERAGGKVIHTSQFKNPALVKDKNVVVLGGGKSATEVTISSKNSGAKSSTMLYRSAHWGTPHKIAGLIPFQFIFLSRFGQALVSLYKGVLPTADSALLKSSHKALRPVMGPVFNIVEAIFAFQLGQRGDFKPENDVVKDFYAVPYLMSPEFITRVNAKDLGLKKGQVAKLTEAKTVQLEKNGEELPCDVLICATGFGKSYQVFDQKTERDLHVEKDGVYLYRHTVPVDVDNLYFCGSELACIFNITSYALQAEWISQVMTGKVKLPEKEAMRQEVEEMKQWKRSWMPESSQRASLVLLHHTHFHDTLLRDMNVKPKRKSNALLEALYPYYPKDYDGIIVKSATA